MSDTDIIKLDITSSARCLPVVRGAVERFAIQEGFDPSAVHEMVLAIDEALANVIKHGYDGQPDKPITVGLSTVCAPDGRPGLCITVRDHGRQVDPTTIRGRDLDEIRPGGLGVHIIKSVMDSVEYSCPLDGGMQLRMLKYVTSCPPCGPNAKAESHGS
jgi:anti-sigma regulatory factor (Ser/Thr protein kinase)